MIINDFLFQIKAKHYVENLKMTIENIKPIDL